MTTKHYSKEFRLQAARLVVEQGYSYAEVAQRLGPSAWSVRQWVDKYRKTGELPADGAAEATGDQMKQLRKENARLRMENDILKKAAAYFAREVSP
jgi:transposase-like protein